MEIKEAKEDLKQRQEAVVKEINQNIAQRRALEQQFQELTREANMLNGEARLLNRLNGDKDSKK